MTANTCLENSICTKLKEYKDTCNIYTFDDEYNKILKLTALSVKTFSNALSKDSIYLEKNDVDRIKNALLTHHNKSTELKAFKDELIKDLGEFQNQIETKHSQQIAECKKRAESYENQLKNIKAEKNKMTLENLLKISWPNSSKTKEYENKLALLKAQAEKYSKRAQELAAEIPIANEKDILMYQIHLKDKYSLPNKQ